MHQLSDTECINGSASVEEALNKFVVGHFESLLVMADDKAVGVLRMSDVVGEILGRLEACNSSVFGQSSDAEAV
jgi:hypothetical protein